MNRAAARLAVVEAGKKSYHDLTEPLTTIGRGRGCTIEIDDRNLSRNHCRIERIEGGWLLSDLDSQNGTSVNDVPVKRAVLRDGDVILIGRTALVFEEAVGAGGEARPSPATDRGRDNLLKLQEIYREVTGELHLPHLLEKIMDRVIEVSGAQRGFLILMAGGKMDFAVARNIEKHCIDRKEFRVSRSIIRNVARTGRPEILDSAKDDTRYGLEHSVAAQELVSVICVPMKLRDKGIGLIYLANDLGRSAFTSDHLSLLEAFAAQAAIAIGNARLYEELLEKQRELKKAKDTVDRLNEKLQEKIENQSREIVLIERSHPKAAFKYKYDQIVGKSEKMREVFKLLDRVIETRVPVLIQGESGTGKELVAKAIHYNGELKDKRFVSVNCGAIVETLLESELFGHVRGSFTGAVRDRAGLFEIADGGTIFLDEIGEMSPQMQAKLLRVLQDGELTPVGAAAARHVRVRVIAASNKNVAALVAERRFREDLFYRLNVIQLTLPPLRERRDDVPLLVDHFLDRLSRDCRGAKRRMDAECMGFLVRYDWPGNVRELENEITRLAALSRGVITAGQLSRQIRAGGLGLMERTEIEGRTLREIKNGAMQTVERQAILTALAACGYKKVKAAKVLGISRPTLDAKIMACGIDLDEKKGGAGGPDQR